MISLFQFFDPSAFTNPMGWAIIALLIWLERRLRRLEEAVKYNQGYQRGREKK